MDARIRDDLPDPPARAPLASSKGKEAVEEEEEVE